MYRSSFHGKKVPKTNTLVHLLSCVFFLKDLGDAVLASLEGSKNKISLAPQSQPWQVFG